MIVNNFEQRKLTLNDSGLCVSMFTCMFLVGILRYIPWHIYTHNGGGDDHMRARSRTVERRPDLSTIVLCICECRKVTLGSLVLSQVVHRAFTDPHGCIGAGEHL